MSEKKLNITTVQNQSSVCFLYIFYCVYNGHYEKHIVYILFCTYSRGVRSLDNKQRVGNVVLVGLFFVNSVMP